MRLSSSSDGKAWLENFGPQADKDAASALLDALVPLSADVLHRELLSLIRQKVGDGSFRAPILLLAAKQVPADYHVFGQGTTAFNDFNPAERIALNPGSEGTVARLIASATRQYKREVLRVPDNLTGLDRPDHGLRHPLLDWLAQQKCRTLLLVQDYSGSGDQLIGLLKALWANTTIKSWKSSKHLDIRCCVHSVSSPALARLDQIPVLDSMHYVRVAPTFSDAPWDEATLKEVRRICYQYSNPTNAKDALGYAGAESLLVPLGKVPNTLPRILWQTRGATPAWRPLFSNRHTPASLDSRINTAADRQSWHRFEKGSATGDPIELMEKALGLAATGEQVTRRTLSAFLNCPLALATSLLSSLETLELLRAGRITAVGRAEWKRLRSGGPPTRHHQAGDYYPWTLREPGSN